MENNYLKKTDFIPELEAMRAGVDFKFRVNLRKYQLTLRPLSTVEYTNMISDVMEKLQNIPEHLRSRLTENLLIAKETLKIASTPDVGSTVVGITDYILNLMTSDEIQYLYSEYVAVVDRVNPSLEEMSKEDVDRLVEDLKKKSVQEKELGLQLTELSHWQLINVARRLLQINAELLQDK
jgi:hypothetical protein